MRYIDTLMWLDVGYFPESDQTQQKSAGPILSACPDWGTILQECMKGDSVHSLT